MNPIAKLRRMSREELAWRAAQALRIHRDRLSTRIRRPRWNRKALLSVLADDVIDPVMRTHLVRGDWRAAHKSIARALRARPRPFVLDPASALDLSAEILHRWPGAAAEASTRADRVLAGRYDLLGYHDLSFDDANGRTDWHLDPVHGRRAPRVFWADVPFLDPRTGDHKIIWELNRHQQWLALGRALWLTRDRRYAWAIVSQLEAWLEANPPLTGINWASALELGFRAMSWVWALHFLLGDTDEGAAGPAQAPWLLDLLLGIDRQLELLEQNLSHYFSPNTHLSGEALALYVTGVALPELAESRRRARTGRRILLEQIAAQVGADGGHVERSTHYHRYTLDFYLLALLTAERAQDTEAITPFTDAVSRLATFTRAMADDNGRLPVIGDDDGGMLWPIAGRATDDVRDSLALAAVVLGRPDLAPWGVPEEVFWIAGRTAIEQEPFIEAYRTDARPPVSATFEDTGFVVSRDGAGGHLVFDVGPHGFMNGGHAHADALAVAVSVNGRPLLVDPGTSTYTMDLALRDRMRSSASHNTLTRDGRGAALPSGPFHWQSRADARLHAARHNPAFDWAEGLHEAYGDGGHRRTVVRNPAAGWLIVDEVVGRGRHTADVHWHFDPAWTVTRERPNLLRATFDRGLNPSEAPSGGAGLQSGVTAWLVHDAAETRLFHGDDEAGLGWCAPVYGTLVPTSSARVSRTAAAPFSIAAFVSSALTPPSLVRLNPDCDPGGAPPIAVRIVQDGVTWTTVLRPGEPPARETRGGRIGAYHTNARLLQYGADDGRLVALCACDVSHVLALRDDWLSVSADESIPDLYIECTTAGIELWASAPRARVRLQGASVAAAPTIRVNGREVPPDARERADSVVVGPSCFGEPRRITPCVGLQVSRT